MLALSRTTSCSQSTAMFVCFMSRPRAWLCVHVGAWHDESEGGHEWYVFKFAQNLHPMGTTAKTKWWFEEAELFVLSHWFWLVSVLVLNDETARSMSVPFINVLEAQGAVSLWGQVHPFRFHSYEQKSQTDLASCLGGKPHGSIDSHFHRARSNRHPQSGGESDTALYAYCLQWCLA